MILPITHTGAGSAAHRQTEALLAPVYMKRNKHSMTQKTTVNNERIVARNDFLAALYPDAPDKLWLELRCIHPKTDEVRSFWAHPDNAKQCEAIFKQADKLNAEGYGAYFVTTDDIRVHPRFSCNQVGCSTRSRSRSNLARPYI